MSTTADAGRLAAVSSRTESPNLDGVSLEALIAAEHRLDELSTARVLGQAALAAHAAHKGGQSFGAFTPSTIGVLPDGGVRLAAGTAATRYRAPETLGGSPADRRSDVFVLGIILWEALTREALFAGVDEAATNQAVADLVVRAPSQLNANVPAELDAICKRALARDPADRYQSAKVMAAEIEAVLDDAGYPDSNAEIAKFVAKLASLPGPVARGATLPTALPIEANRSAAPIGRGAPSHTASPIPSILSGPSKVIGTVPPPTGTLTPIVRPTSVGNGNPASASQAPVNGPPTSLAQHPAPAVETAAPKSLAVTAFLGSNSQPASADLAVPSVADSPPANPALFPASSTVPQWSKRPDRIANTEPVLTRLLPERYPAPGPDPAPVPEPAPASVTEPTQLWHTAQSDSPAAPLAAPAQLRHPTQNGVPVAPVAAPLAPASEPTQIGRATLNATSVAPPTAPGFAPAPLRHATPVGVPVAPVPAFAPAPLRHATPTGVPVAPLAVPGSSRMAADAEPANPIDAVSLPGRAKTNGGRDVLAGWGWSTDSVETFEDDDENVHDIVARTSRKRLLFAIGGAVAVALILSVIAFAFSSGKQQDHEQAAATPLAPSRTAPPPPPPSPTAPRPPVAAAATEPAVTDQPQSPTASVPAVTPPPSNDPATTAVAANPPTPEPPAPAPPAPAPAKLAASEPPTPVKLAAEPAKIAAQTEPEKIDANVEVKTEPKKVEPKVEAKAEPKAEPKKIEAKKVRRSESKPEPKPEKLARAKPQPIDPYPATDRPKADPAATYRTGLQQYARGDTTAALATLRGSLSTSPGYPPTWRGLGLVYEKLANTSQARAAFKRYLQLAPNAPDADQIKDRLERLGL